MFGLLVKQSLHFQTLIFYEASFPGLVVPNSSLPSNIGIPHVSQVLLPSLNLNSIPVSSPYISHFPPSDPEPANSCSTTTSPTSDSSTKLLASPNELLPSIPSHVQPISDSPYMDSSSWYLSPPTNRRPSTHPMITRSRTGSLRPKVFSDYTSFYSTCYPLLALLSILPHLEPTSYSKAATDSR